MCIRDSLHIIHRTSENHVARQITWRIAEGKTCLFHLFHHFIKPMTDMTLWADYWIRRGLRQRVMPIHLRHPRSKCSQVCKINRDWWLLPKRSHERTLTFLETVFSLYRRTQAFNWRDLRIRHHSRPGSEGKEHNMVKNYSHFVTMNIMISLEHFSLSFYDEGITISLKIIHLLTKRVL